MPFPAPLRFRARALEKTMTGIKSIPYGFPRVWTPSKFERALKKHDLNVKYSCTRNTENNIRFCQRAQKTCLEEHGSSEILKRIPPSARKRNIAGFTAFLALQIFVRAPDPELQINFAYGEKRPVTAKNVL